MLAEVGGFGPGVAAPVEDADAEGAGIWGGVTLRLDWRPVVICSGTFSHVHGLLGNAPNRCLTIKVEGACGWLWG